MAESVADPNIIIVIIIIIINNQHPPFISGLPSSPVLAARPCSSPVAADGQLDGGKLITIIHRNYLVVDGKEEGELVMIIKPFN